MSHDHEGKQEGKAFAEIFAKGQLVVVAL